MLKQAGLRIAHARAGIQAMKTGPRILLLADTHLGFDLPLRPRVERPRRGADFFRNFELALRPALQGKVDLVIHGGDLAQIGVVRKLV